MGLMMLHPELQELRKKLGVILMKQDNTHDVDHNRHVPI